MASTHVVSVDSLDKIYPRQALLSQGARWDKLSSTFEETYGKRPDFISRCPGRVNVIGEHIDYMLYEVLPMAVTVDLLIAVAVVPQLEDSTESTIRIANVEPEKFPSRSFTVKHGKEGVKIDGTKHEWSNYFKAGFKGALDVLRKNGKTAAAEKPVSMDVMVHGIVPSGSGLSSSAAFTCASALATLAANGEKDIDKEELVNTAIVSERFVGVNSGGMDQAASVFGEAGNALYVSFTPSLKAHPFRFPSTEPPIVFLVAQSYVIADKRVTAPVNYNLRVVETTLAAEVLAKKFNVGPLPNDHGPLGRSLRGFQSRYFEKQGIQARNVHEHREQFSKELEEMVELVKKALDKTEGYTESEIAVLLGITVQDLHDKYMTLPVKAERFKLQQRAVHVFSEALRVIQFTDILKSAPSEASTSLLESLGALMNESQASCREFYECSCPELDELCELARDAGAYGSRLTGAGWGGCSVHLVTRDKLEAVKEAWKSEYYAKRFPHVLKDEESLGEAIVVSEPSTGAVLYKFSFS